MRNASARLIASILTGSCLVLAACDGEEDVSPPARGEADTATPDAPDAPVDSGARTTPGADVQVEPELQTAMNEYVSNLNETNEVLAEVDSAVEAAAASPKLAPIVDQLKSFKTRWDGLDPAKKEQLTSAFRDQLQPVIDQLNQQIERVRSDPTFGSQLESLLGEIPLIEI